VEFNQILKILLVVAGSAILGIAIILGVFTYYPEVIGLEEEPSNLDSLANVADTLQIDPTIEITKDRLDEFMQYRMEKFNLRKEKDSLLVETTDLIDSIDILKDVSANYLDSVNMTLAERDSVIKQRNETLDSLNKLYRNLQDKIKELELAQKRINDQDDYIEQKIDSVEIENFKTFAKMYNNTNPAEVARILEQIDERDASKILKFMQTKKAGKVLESMQPERAAAIMLLGTNDW
jgi:flagellar motility protein MotE (MotC chaperone)